MTGSDTSILFDCTAPPGAEFLCRYVVGRLRSGGSKTVSELVDTQEGTRYRLGAVTTIGRAPSCRIVLADRLVSRLHAEVRSLPGGRYLVVDHDSAHGTYVGDRRISEHVLSAGDEIILGATRLRYEDDTAGEEAARSGTAPPGADPHVQLRLAVGDDGVFPPASSLDAESLRNNHEKLRAAYHLSRAIAESGSLDALLAGVIDTTFRFLAADRMVVLLAKDGELRAAAGRDRDGRRVDVRISTTIIDEVVSHMSGLLLLDAGEDERFARAESVISAGIRSAMCVPMMHAGELVGALYLDSLAASRVFEERDIELFAAIAGQAAMAIRNFGLRAEIAELNRDLQHRVEARTRELLETQRQLMEAKKMAAVGELGAGAAHQINNPLWGVLGMAQLLLGKHPAGDDDHPLLKSIEEEALRIRDIVWRLLEHAQGGDAGMARVKIRDLLEEVVHELHEELQEKAIRIDLQVPDDAPAVLGRYGDLKRVVREILDNAGQATPEGETIRVEARGSPGEVIEITVADTGAGMDRETLERAFEPFYTTREDAAHPGLGLSTVYHLVHQHNGRITMESTAESGTTITLVFPAMQTHTRLV